MAGDDLLQNFYKAINITMRPKKRKKVITNVFNWQIKTSREYLLKNSYNFSVGDIFIDKIRKPVPEIFKNYIWNRKYVRKETIKKIFNI